MKKSYKIIIVLAGLIITSGIVQAQKKNVFKANIFSPLVRTGSFFYERAITESSSLQLGFFFSGYSRDDDKFSGFGITPEYRFYLSEKPAPTGFFIAPYFRYQNYKIENDVNKATLSVIGGGLLVGGQILLKDIITMEVFLGPSYGSGSLDIDTGTEDNFSIDLFDGFGARLGVTVGVAF